MPPATRWSQSDDDVKLCLAAFGGGVAVETGREGQRNGAYRQRDPGRLEQLGPGDQATAASAAPAP